MAKRILLLSDFYIPALGQIRHFAGSVPGAYGLAENVEDSASRIAVLGVYQVLVVPFSFIVTLISKVTCLLP